MSWRNGGSGPAPDIRATLAEVTDRQCEECLCSGRVAVPLGLCSDCGGVVCSIHPHDCGDEPAELVFD